MHHSGNGLGDIDHNRQSQISRIISEGQTSRETLPDAIIWTISVTGGMGVAIWAILTMMELATC